MEVIVEANDIGKCELGECVEISTVFGLEESEDFAVLLFSAVGEWTFIYSGGEKINK